MRSHPPNKNMISMEPQPAAPQGDPRRFQFSLRTLLLLFVVLASSLAVFGPGGIVVFAIVVGLAVYVRQVASFWSLTQLVLVVVSMMCLIGLLLPAYSSVSEAARRVMCVNQMKQIALALQNYHSANGSFPPAYIADKNGKPMHSWRVLILPYMEYDSLYKQYNFNEPWDGPNNKKLLAMRPYDYACPSDPKARAPGATHTSYVAVVGPTAAWTGAKSRKIGPADFPGGTRRTIMVVEVADSGIAWTEPRDFSLDVLGTADAKSSPLSVSSKHFQEESFFFTYDRGPGAFAAMADGSVTYLPPANLSTENLRQLLQVDGYPPEDVRTDAEVYRKGQRPNWPNIASLGVWLFSVGLILYVAVKGRKSR